MGYPSRMPSPTSPDLHAWLRTPLGQRVYALERKLASEALAQVFGWQLLQIGLWGDDDGLIVDGRTQRKSVLAWHGSRPTDRPAPIRSRTDCLAVASDSVDAVMLPPVKVKGKADEQKILRVTAVKPVMATRTPPPGVPWRG